VSLLATLEAQDCFKESAFKDAFSKVQKLFPDNKYEPRKRGKMKKVLAAIPDVNNVKVRQSDVANIQKLMNLVGEYVHISNGQTVFTDNLNFKFIEKFSNLNILNARKSLGLDFTSRDLSDLVNLITNHQITAQQAVGAGINTVTPPTSSNLPNVAANATVSVDTFGNVIAKV
jgi:hypothetical protein